MSPAAPVDLGSAAVQMRALEILHADRARPVEEHAGHQRVGLYPQSVRMTLFHREQTLPRAHPTKVTRRQRDVAGADLVRLHPAPVVRVAQTLEPLERGEVELLQLRADRGCQRRPNLRIGNGVFRLRLLGGEPAAPAVSRRIGAEPAEESLKSTMAAILEPFEVRPHVIRAPGLIAREVRKLVPVGVVGVDEDHRVVRRAATQRSRPGVPDAVDPLVVVVLDVLAILALLDIVGVVADEEVPLDRVVLRRQRMERRHRIVLGVGVLVGMQGIAACDGVWVAAGLEHQHGVAGLHQARRDRAPACAGTDDDVVGA